MLEKISFKASPSQSIWSAFQNNNKETDKSSVSNPASNMQSDNFVRTNVENDKSNNYSAYIWGGVIAAALIGAGIWYYVSHGKNPVKTKTTPNPVPAPKPIQPPPINNKTFSISFKNIMSSFVDKIAIKDKNKYLSELSQQKLRRVDCFKLLKDEGIKHQDVIYSKEIPVKTKDRIPGSTSLVPPVAGIYCAYYIINKILKDL